MPTNGMASKNIVRICDFSKQPDIIEPRGSA